MPSLTEVCIYVRMDGWMYMCVYIQFFKFVDRFTALRFTVTDAQPAARRIRILPMNQHG
jgi:hypothetical protein